MAQRDHAGPREEDSGCADRPDGAGRVDGGAGRRQCCVAATLRRFHLFGYRHRLFLEECHWRPIADHFRTDPVPDAVWKAAKTALGEPDTIWRPDRGSRRRDSSVGYRRPYEVDDDSEQPVTAAWKKQSHAMTGLLRSAQTAGSAETLRWPSRDNRGNRLVPLLRFAEEKTVEDLAVLPIDIG